MDSVEDLIGLILQTYTMPVILALGFLGNFLAFLVFSRNFFRRTSCGFYLKALTVTDTTSVIAYVFSFIIHGLNVDMRTDSVFFCKLVWFLFYAPCAWSAWIEAFICVDRMVHIVAPSKFRFMDKRGFARVVIAVIILFNTVLYSPLVYYYNVVKSTNIYNSTTASINDTYSTANSTYIIVEVEQSCECTSDLYNTVLSWYDLLNSTLLPCFFMVVCTGVMLYKIRKSRKSISKKSESFAPTQPAVSRQSVVAQHESSKKRREQRDRQFAITSISLCILFFALNVGIVIFNSLCLYNLVADKDFLLLNGLTLNLFIADYSIKFYLYLLVNHHFLYEFKGLFLSRFNDRNTSMGKSNNSVQGLHSNKSNPNVMLVSTLSNA